MIVLVFLLFSFSLFAHNHENDKKPKAKLKLSDHECKSPCKITLDGSKSEASKEKIITKYIFDIGNGDIIESATPMIEYTYINFVEDNDLKKKDRYKMWKKYIDWCHKKFKKYEKFEPSLKMVQSDNQISKSDEQKLLVKGSDILPTIDGDDLVPPKPNQIENDSTLLGLDIDGDNVRDDLELWANQITADVGIRKALKQNLKYSRLMFANINDPTLAKLYVKKAMEGTRCIIHQVTKDYADEQGLRKMSYADKLISEKNSLDYNTKDRIMSEVNSRKYIEGFSSYQNGDASSKCEF